MKWANFLHIYQPADQQPDILRAIVDQCYRPIISHIANAENIKITLNITGALIELFDKNGYRDIIEQLKQAGEQGKIEFTSSAKYHGFLPLLSDEDIVRQIKANDETMVQYLGKKAYKPKGFFPPEMGFNHNIVSIIEKLGYKWIILDEISGYSEPERIDYTKIYKIKDSNLNVFFRERRLSNLIMSAVVRSKETLLQAMKQDLQSERYIVTAMDGETFGHHRPGLEKMLFDIFDTKDFNLVTISDLLKDKRDIVEISPVPSTWASSKEDIEKGIQFLSWKDPENKIHAWQWELFYLVRNEVEKIDKKSPVYEEIKKKMDIGTASDHFWWASAKPWWSLEMIEDGEYRLLETVRMIPGVSEEILRKARDLYEKIISTAFQWQRTGKIRSMMTSQNSILRIPFKDRTIGRGGAEEGVYHAFIDMMKTQEKLASLKGEYEKAILWRDSIYKLENKLDIYDTINAIDLLRIELPNEEVEKTILKYKEKYRAIRGGQPEQRGS
jgi:alpha-amylase/alpha-mannosidase (GH57 family)